eukprot:SAG11_NODE_9360_length_919_cov_0.936585_1_plen_179_part_00
MKVYVDLLIQLHTKFSNTSKLLVHVPTYSSTGRWTGNAWYSTLYSCTPSTATRAGVTSPWRERVSALPGHMNQNSESSDHASHGAMAGMARWFLLPAGRLPGVPVPTTVASTKFSSSMNRIVWGSHSPSQKLQDPALYQHITPRFYRKRLLVRYFWKPVCVPGTHIKSMFESWSRYYM